MEDIVDSVSLKKLQASPGNKSIESFLKKRETLIKRFIKRGERRFLEYHTKLFDEYFLSAYESSEIGPKLQTRRNPFAFIALGGYGRGEQCIHSDIDLLILFKKKVPREAEELVQELIYPLWDAGFQVGLATRSLGDVAGLHHLGIEELTTVLDCRFLCGFSPLFSAFRENINKKIVRKRGDRLIQEILQNTRGRHLKFGDSTYLIRPNLKEGKGGLRDYHTILWIARIKSGISSPGDIKFSGCLSHDECESMEKALSFIWNVRNRLHYAAGKKMDQLHLEYQEILAGELHYVEKQGLGPVERFLGKLHGQMSLLKNLLRIVFHELNRSGRKKPHSNLPVKIPGIIIRNGVIEFQAPEILYNQPDLLMRIFEVSALKEMPIGTEARRLIKDFKRKAGKKFRKSPEVVKSFEKIISRSHREMDPMTPMANTGLLLRFIPEFRHIVDRIQYDEYHMYPVDKHSIRTLREMRGFTDMDNPYYDPYIADIFGQISDKVILLWAALLHDIGKGEAPGGHSEKGAKITAAILAEKGYSKERIETASFLVAEHLLLFKTATRRDIQNEETAIFCARKIGNPERLKMLFLLSVADAIATGPKAWNEWTAALLRELFSNVLALLEKGELATKEAEENAGKKLEDLTSFAVNPAERQFFESVSRFLSPRYKLYISADEMANHIRLFRKMENRRFVWNIEKDRDQDTRTITICAKDAPGLFSIISGVLTINQIDILNVQVYTWQNNIALDIFQVSPPPDRIFESQKWKKAEKDLEHALSGKIKLREILSTSSPEKWIFNPQRPKTMTRPNRVNVDNRSSGYFTIVEVFAYDFPGLLFRITDALFQCGLDIWVAKIATKVDQVVDVFYVRDLDGQKADSSEQEDRIRSKVLASLPK